MEISKDNLKSKGDIEFNFKFWADGRGVFDVKVILAVNSVNKPARYPDETIPG